MSQPRGIFRVLVYFTAGILLLLPPALLAQTATSGLVSGQVTDPSGAAVPAARVMLIQGATGSELTAKTDATGHYVFPVVPPASYTLRVTKSGFRSGVVSSVDVELQKSTTVNVKLQVGRVSQSVTVSATSGVQLQTTNATVGNVLNTASLVNLPQVSRDASSLMFLQPAINPNSRSGSASTGGQIAGARSDQVQYMLDGGDATSNFDGTDVYPNSASSSRSFGAESSTPVIPNPIATTQEFRVVTAGATGTFSRAQGGQVTVLTKHGTNAFHGTVYEYHDDSAFDANSWRNNAIKLHKPHSVDNRFGANLGGPLIWPHGGRLLTKNRAWFFFGWEEHRFNDSSTLTRLVPTDTLRKGILQFRDASGNTVNYSLVPGHISSNCGPSGTTLCDPRNLGLSPAIGSELGLYPTGNNTSLGDGLNTTGFTFSLGTPLREDIGVVRLDFKVNSNWSLLTSYHLARVERAATSQVNIVSSPPSVASRNPAEPSMLTFQVIGHLTPTFTSVIHGSFLRNQWEWIRTPPTSFATGSAQPLQLAGEGVGSNNGTSKLLTDPININSQQARSRLLDGKTYFIADDMSYIHGHHLFQMGASGYITQDYFKTEFPIGGLASGPTDFVEARGNGSGAFVTIGSAFQPEACTASVTTACLPTNQAVRFNELYSSVLGLVDHGAQIGARDGRFQPLPLGTLDVVHETLPAFYLYFQDTWQMTRHLTSTVGLDWGVQLPTSESDGRLVVITDPNGVPINPHVYLSERRQSLEQQGVSIVNGKVNAFNPNFAITPSAFIPSGGALPRTQLRVTDWHEFGPRVSLAWNAPYHNWFFGNNGQTVIRGSYSILFDRTNSGTSVFSSVFSGGIADLLTCRGPVMNGTCSGGATDPTNAFRMGVDGNSIPIPQVKALPIPWVPSGTQSAPFGDTVITPVDPFATPGWSHNVTLSMQRALPGNMLLEVGYIGRFSRNLQEGIPDIAPDYLMKDAVSGQTYGQAFDGVAQALRNGTTVPDEPFFDNLIGLSSCQNKGFANCSLMVAAQDPTDLVNGALDEFSVFAFNFDTPGPIDNLQTLVFSQSSDGGFSNYDAGYLSLRKMVAGRGPLGGLSMQFNYTLSHAQGNQGHVQNSLNSPNSPYNLNLDYSSEPFDRRSVISAWWNYPLPFGRGAWRSFDSALVNRIVGGWRWSGIWTMQTGLPLCIKANGDYGGNFAFNPGTCAIGMNGFSLSSVSGNDHINVTGSGGIGTSTLGLNLFKDPAAVFNSLRRPLLSQDGNVPFDALRAPLTWNMDFEISKNVAATERYRIIFAADLLNAFNHPNFGGTSSGFGPSLSLNSPASFGAYTAQTNLPRQIQLSLRVSF